MGQVDRAFSTSVELSIRQEAAPLRLVSALLIAFVIGALAQTPSAPVAIRGGVGPVLFLRFSPNGGELAVISGWGPVALFETSSYRRARTFITERAFCAAANCIGVVAYSPDGTRMATAEGTNGARVWNAVDRGEPIPTKGWILAVSELYALKTPVRVLQEPSGDIRAWDGRSSRPTANF